MFFSFWPILQDAPICARLPWDSSILIFFKWNMVEWALWSCWKMYLKEIKRKMDYWGTLFCWWQSCFYAWPSRNKRSGKYFDSFKGVSVWALGDGWAADRAGLERKSTVQVHRLCLVISFNLQVILLVLKYKDVNGILVAQSQYFCYQTYMFLYLWVKKRSTSEPLDWREPERSSSLSLPPVFFWYSEVYRPKRTALSVSQLESQDPLQFSPAAQMDTPGYFMVFFMVFYAPFISWVAEAQNFTVTLRDAARQPDIIWGQQNADSLSKLREGKHCELPEGELLADGMHLAVRKFVTNCSDFACTGMLLWDAAGCWCLDCCCPTAITVNPLLEARDESSLEPASPKNLHNQPLALGAWFWFAEMAAALWQMYNGNGGMIKGTGGS